MLIGIKMVQFGKFNVEKQSWFITNTLLIGMKCNGRCRVCQRGVTTKNGKEMYDLLDIRPNSNVILALNSINRIGTGDLQKCINAPVNKEIVRANRKCIRRTKWQFLQ